jgi:lysophospholipase L1-like esterase
MTRLAKAAASLFILVVSMSVALLAAEGILRLKNLSMDNYDIEMWRYAKELKQPSDDPRLGHEHRPGESAVLQSVEIRLNELGMRGDSVLDRRPDVRRILFLGSSITLGWGIGEDETVTVRLGDRFREDGVEVEVLNSGIGNYNAARYVERFFRDLRDLEPTDIVVHYFVNDAEHLEAGGGNALLRNSQLAVMLWIAIQRTLAIGGGETLVDHYREVYRPDQPGYAGMREALARLAGWAEPRGVRLYLAMTPDVHNLESYPLGFVHEEMRSVASELGYTFVDLLPAMQGVPAEDMWAMPGDPHPNALGHELMAGALYPVLTTSPEGY